MTRDYLAWHDSYDDAGSGLSWRLAKVQGYLRDEFDRRGSELRVVSVCAGDGRDVLGVLDGRSDAARVRVTLLEIHPQLVAAAREHAYRLPAQVDVREADAGRTDAYGGAVPADVLVLVGVLGNLTDADAQRTLDAVPQLCSSGALVIWSRGLFDDVVEHRDNDALRAQLDHLGCTELDYAEHASDDGRTAVGAVRFAGTPQPLPPGERLFTFVR